MKILNQKFTFGELAALLKKGLKILINPKKLINLIKFELSLHFSGFRHLNYYPIIFNVEPTSHCNLRCPMCSVSYENLERKKGYFEMDLYKRLIDEIGDYAILLCLWNVGEPLLHPGIDEMISYAGDRNIFTAIHSNGVVLKGKLADDIITSGLDYLSISFDGATKEIYEKFRKGANFEEVTENINNFCKRKKQLKSRSPIVNMQFIIMKENEHQVDLFRTLAKGLGVDKVSYRRFTYVPSPDNKDYKHLRDEFLPKNRKFVYNAFNNRKVKNDNGCKRVWVSSALTYDAAVNACCVESSNLLNFGNIREQGFKEIWDNQRYRHFREKLFEDSSTSDICKRCMLKDYFQEQQL